MFDYHVHTPFCRHASGRMEQYVEVAVAKGLEEICFTPHIPLPGFPRGGSSLRMDPRDTDRYFEALEQVRGRYREIIILSGMEADYYEGYEEYLEGFLSRYPLDLVLMSVHFIHSWPQSQWLFGFHFPDKPLSRVYHEYFEELKKAIRTGLFDCLAHLDLVKQPGHPVLQTNEDDVAEVIELCARQGMSIELNTAGLRRPVRETYPAAGIFPLIAGRGVPLVLGSDAHEPELVGFRLEEASALAAEVPRLRIARYRKRKMAADRGQGAAATA